MLKLLTLYRHIKELETRLEASIAANQQLASNAFIIGIERNAGSRTNKFTFVRNGEFYVIETMGLMSDNAAQWKRDLLE